MKQYMQKHQTLEPMPDSITDASTMPFDAAHHGSDGPVRTSFNDTLLPVEDLVITAAEKLTGYAKKPLDPWSGDHIGFFRTLGSVVRTGLNKGKRSYAARGYFEPNRARPNLTVLCDATVIKVVLEGATAVGVAFVHGGAAHEARVKREVLVCAGSVQSPQILELSGIGDPAILKAVGVEPKVALPDVGAHFQDHTTTLLAYTLKPGHVSLDALKDPANFAAAVGVLGEKGEGLLTCISSCQGFFPYKKIVSAEELRKTVESVRGTKAESDFERRQLELVARQLESDTSANLQLVVIPTSGDFEAGVADQSVLYSKPVAPGTNTFSLVVLMSYPASRGSVHITSAGSSLLHTVSMGS
jgi:choline dehydrogenase-like flavoprotein